MIDKNCSIIETVYNMPELKSCPIETTFRIIGKRWTVLIIREILRGHTQFNRFIENIEGITPKVLTDRLRELEHLGIIRRRIVSEYPVRVEYSLTDLGKGFEPVLFRFVFIKGTGNIFESDPDSNSIGIYLGSSGEPTITTGKSLCLGGSSHERRFTILRRFCDR
jgi:DNA-binding HxlR family transcriptional regulator